jgi:hypothetical protein
MYVSMYVCMCQQYKNYRYQHTQNTTNPQANCVLFSRPFQLQLISLLYTYKGKELNCRTSYLNNYGLI